MPKQQRKDNKPDAAQPGSGMMDKAQAGAQRPGAQGKTVQASEQERQQLELFIANGRKIINEAGEQILGQIQAQDPVDGVATATVMVLERLQEAALESGAQLSPDVVISAGAYIMGDIIALYEQSGGEPFNDEQKYQAFSLAASMYIDNALKSGKITPEELQAFADMMAQSEEGQKVAQEVGYKPGAASPQSKGAAPAQQNAPAPTGAGLLE
jgi:hypothetical protein